VDVSKSIYSKEYIWLASRSLFSRLSEIVFADWTGWVFLKPVRDALRMKEMLAWKLHELLPLLKVTIANHTLFLIFF